MIIDVIPEVKTVGDQGFFSYKVSQNLSDKIQIGSIVQIPFGKKKIRGVVKSLLSDVLHKDFKLKEIISVSIGFLIPKTYLEIANWVSEYYLCSLGEAISLFLPTEIIRPRSEKENPKKSEAKKKKLNVLTLQQKKIIKELSKKLFQSSKKPSLLYGVTGSGKTEIYLALAKKTIDLGKSVIILVPEIILTPQNIERFEEIFGDQVSVMHSSLSRSEKFLCYKNFHSGEKKIIIGPRSALLVPSDNLGLIIIDEEQEDSYKQERSPRYDAVTLGEQIAKKSGALLILGSATPRIETFYKTKTKEFDLSVIPERYNSKELPLAEVVDLRDEIKRENYSLISKSLEQALYEVLNNKEQAVLFLNRRGMSTFVSCRLCSEVIFCKHCDVPMVYHFDNRGNYLVCHHCDRKSQVPTICPKCGSPKIKYFGAGIEKIENELREKYPKAKIIRIDSKVLQSHKEYDDFYQNFKQHKFDFVVGTQILAKGFDIPGVALVGIISADVGLHLPYFRASEKIFRLITQISGRSGRREKTGKTIIQTYWPEMATIKYAKKHDFQGFYKEEIVKRLKKNYPPKVHIVRVLSENFSQEKTKSEIGRLAFELKKEKIDFLGPGLCFFQKIKNQYRYQIIIKIKNLPDERIKKFWKIFPNLIWDVDPLNLL